MTEAAPGGPVRWQDATVASLAVRTPRIKSVVLSPSRPFGFRAGQHVDIRLTAEDGYRAIRSYSIASGPETTGTLELAIERLDDGEVSPFFHDVVAAGDVIEVKGPLGGHFVWPGADAGPVLLVGGGSGVAPLMSMVRHRAAIRSDLPTVLLLSARTWDDVLFRDELIALAGRGDGFSLVLAITREAPRRPGDFGRRVDAAMMAAIVSAFPAPPGAAFVCGTNSFVNAAADGALAAGVPASAIRTERYGGV